MIKGLHIHFANYDADEVPFNWPSVDYSVIRLHDGGVSWRDIETQKGIFDFNRLGRIFSGAASRGKDLIWDCHGIPEFAASTAYDAGYGPGSGSAPILNHWQEFIRKFVCHCRGNVKYWEGVNEWGHESMTADIVIEMQKILWRVVKAVDPGMIVLSPSSPHIARLTEIVDGIRPYCDIISHHFYDPSDFGSQAETTAEALSLADGKPVWDTEYGWQESSIPGSENFADMTDAERIDVLATHWNDMKSGGIETAIIHSWNGVMGFENAPVTQTAWNALA